MTKARAPQPPVPEMKLDVNAPWIVEGFKNLIVNDARGVTLALCPGDTTCDSIAAVQLNARLIAAAPALFDALRLLVLVTTDYAHCDDLFAARQYASNTLYSVTQESP